MRNEWKPKGRRWKAVEVEQAVVGTRNATAVGCVRAIERSENGNGNTKGIYWAQTNECH